MAHDMIIVGAGIAGLSTGYYAQLNGFRSVIFEMHSIPGGLCTAFTRKGYTFDLSMHMLVGSRYGALNRMWRELGVVDGQQRLHYPTEAGRVEGLDKSLTLYTDPRRLLDQLIDLSPADAERSRRLVRLVSGPGMMGSMSLKAPELWGLWDTAKMAWGMVPHIGNMLRYGGKTFQDLVAEFKDPFLRDALRFMVDSPPWPMPRFPMMAALGMWHSAVADAGVPLGGSYKAVSRIADRYEERGGEIRFRQRVKDVIVEDERAVGVCLEDGTEHRAETVVWAADGHALIFDMFGGRYVDDQIKKMYETWSVVESLVHVSLGVARDLSDEPPRLVFELEEPIEIAGRTRRWLGVMNRCFDPSMAPAGKSAVEVWYPTPFEHWRGLHADRARYKEEKKRISDATIAELDKRWPGIASDVEVVDVATPMTYVRYTGNWQGSPDGWYLSPENITAMTPLRRLPGLSKLHMVGQWTCPFAGTVMSALAGRQLVELLCRDGKKSFVTSTTRTGARPSASTRT